MKKFVQTLAICGTAAMWVAPIASVAAEPVMLTATQRIQSAPQIDLRITYEAMSIGSDGVQRSSVYTNRVYRRSAQLWIERELPEALQHSNSHGHEHAHGPHAGHAHDEARGAPLFIKRAEDGKVSVEAVLAKLKRVISVDEAHHGNVGFGGSFENVYWIVPPASLQNMERVGKPVNGLQRYRSVAGEQTTLIDWDVANQFAQRVERKDAHGMERIVITAKRLPLPLAQPWLATKDFERGDYSDLLD
ncbi:hypothetical protein [Diaphorobacter sp. HDW4B]|uniref:hypothetical protein n=1 Tax=Diaphorobacter sp. HDW4B TaxID=2714925 RepID=UPI001F10C7D7|nr:hypothetical protein [Diaphorobacter sp. HDW4B]